MSTGKKIILIVDPSLVVLQRMVSIVEELPNVEFVVHAGSYKEAMDLLTGLRPDMILMDIDLPDKNGIELLKTIRQQDGNAIVYITTNFVSDQHRDLCKKLGARRFFDKSADYELITEAVAYE
ncbi:MAG: response regulator transcription factor [Bacteroidetes bacterium]|nr:response regulator transcription factor [Bacteroidota bacterium]